MRVLIVEDTHMMAIAVCHALKQIKVMHTTVAASGEEAVMMIAGSTKYDLFLVDTVLPGMSGLDIVRHLREQPRYAKTPIIMTTGNDRVEDVKAALEAGANAYLVKPIRKEILIKRVVEYSMRGLRLAFDDDTADAA